MTKSLGSHDYVQSLKGQTLKFPNFDKLFNSWPKGTNLHYDSLRQAQDAVLSNLLEHDPRLDAVKACDCAYNASTWWPTSSYDAIQFASAFVAFLYLWDNEMDSPEFSDLVQDRHASEAFIEETIDLMKAYQNDDDSSHNLPPKQLKPPLESFRLVGEAATSYLTKSQRLFFLDECIRYVKAVGNEQQLEQRGRAPTTDEYLRLRHGTSGVQAIVATIEYMVNVDLGDELRSDPDVQTVFDETNCVISIMNDMFSLRRELQFPFYCNIVAVLYHQHQDLQTAVDKTYDIVARSVRNIDAAALRLVDRFPERSIDLQNFVKGAKTMITGNIAWSMRIKRYRLGISSLDGTTEIVI